MSVDAIVVPGGGSQRGESPSTLPPWVTRRLDAAMDQYHRSPLPKPKIVVLSAGTPHRPNFINSAGWPVLEATSEALYLIEESAARFGPEGSIPPQDILREMISLDTIGNAYFLRAIHTEVAGYRRLHVITSAFHLPRTQAIFEFVFALSFDGVSAAPQYTLTFEAVSDEGLGETADIAGRSERERQSLVSFRQTMQREFGVVACEQTSIESQTAVDATAWNIPRACEAAAAKDPFRCSLRNLHRWLFAHHKAYCTHDGMVRHDVVDLNAHSTY